MKRTLAQANEMCPSCPYNNSVYTHARCYICWHSNPHHTFGTYITRQARKNMNLLDGSWLEHIYNVLPKIKQMRYFNWVFTGYLNLRCSSNNNEYIVMTKHFPTSVLRLLHKGPRH